MISTLLNNNYSDILSVARNITRRKGVHRAKDLITSTYIRIHNKEVPTNDKEFIKFFCKCMYLDHLCKWSEFNKLFETKDSVLEYDPGNEDWKNIEINAEYTSLDNQDGISELSHLNKEKAIKYSEVMIFKYNLPPHEQELFTLYFEEGLSGAAISTIIENETGYKTNSKRFDRMIRVIKNKIEEQTWSNL